MRALAVILLAGGLATGGCATPIEPGVGPRAGGGDDCAVIAAVAKEHYGFGPTSAPPPLWLVDDDPDWAPRCDWARLGVPFTRIYDAASARPGDTKTWVRFEKPTYDGLGAVILTDLVRNGRGPVVECRVHAGVAGWTVGECEVVAEFT